jgi:hypothetical protein
VGCGIMAPAQFIITIANNHRYSYSSSPLFLVLIIPNHCCSCSSYLSSLLLIFMFVFLLVIVLLCPHTHHTPIHPIHFLVVHCSYLSSLSSCHILLLKLPF